MKFLPLLISAVLLTACHSTKDVSTTTSTSTTPTTTTTTATTTPTTNNASSSSYVARVRSNAQTANAITAKMKFDLNGSGKNISFGGSLKMKRDEVIQMSFTMMGFELARMEFSPNDVLVISRADQTYLHTNYASIGFLKNAGLDFYALQALLWNELFIPGTDANALDDKLRVSSAGSHTLLAADNVKSLNYDFLTLTESALIDNVTVKGSTAAQSGKFEMKYADFTTVGGKQFPTTLTCSITAENKTRGFAITLSKLNNNSDWESHTTLSSKYTTMKSSDLLGKFFK